MSRDRFKTFINLTGAFGFTCFTLALMTNHITPAIDRYFGWAIEESVFREVFLVGSVGQRWSGFAEIMMILGLIGLAASLAVSFISKVRYRKPS